MSQALLTFRSLLRQPSAYVPIAMSLLGLATIVVGPWIFHDLHSADEGPTAHLWQLSMAGQLPVVVFFALKWLRRAPREALRVLCLQAGAVVANLALVFALGVG